MRLIDADKLLNDGIRVRCCFNDDGLIMVPMRDVRKSIQNAPTVDAVEVVRCKDCKGMNEDKFCCAWEGFVRDDDFCSYGERKTDG